MVGNNTNQFTLSIFGVIYAIAIIIVAIGHLSGESFGLLGFISWIVILAGVIAFINNIIKSFNY